MLFRSWDGGVPRGSGHRHAAGGRTAVPDSPAGPRLQTLLTEDPGRDGVRAGASADGGMTGAAGGVTAQASGGAGGGGGGMGATVGATGGAGGGGGGMGAATGATGGISLTATPMGGSSSDRPTAARISSIIMIFVRLCLPPEAGDTGRPVRRMAGAMTSRRPTWTDPERPRWHGSHGKTW